VVLTNVAGQSYTARVVILAILMLLVGGCSPTAEPTGLWGRLWKIEVGPDYQRPEVKQVGEFRSQLSPSDAASLSDIPWWSVFKDPVLKYLIAEALANNYDLQLATAHVMQARSLVWVAASPLYPHLGYQAFAGRERTFVPLETPGGNLTYDNFAGFFSAVWELDVWGRVRRSTEAARANLFAQEYFKRGVMLTLVSDVATGYFRLVELDRELSIAQESSKTYAQTLNLFAQRYKFGKDSKLPVARAQANRDSSIANIAALHRAITQQENALSILLGSYPRPIGRGELLAAQTTPATPTGLTSDLLQRRPDILAAEQTMIGANAQVGVAVANFFPRIGLSALYGGQGTNIDNVVQDSFSIWNIFGNVAGPIFQGGALLETYYAQQSFWDATIAQYKQTILVAFREVSDALVAQQTLTAQREALVKQVDSLKEAVALALLRYDAGRASYFEVLEAEQQLFPAEDALAQTERDQLLAVVDLYKALGGGWNISDAGWMRPI
jgi:multidrug efflux system outer membrane protein